MEWIIAGLAFSGIIAGTVALGSRHKIGRWADERSTNREAGRQKREASIFVHSEKLKTSNGFTRTLDEAFNKGHWKVKDSPFTVTYVAPNPLGDIAGLVVRFDIYMNGIHMEYFEKSVSNIKAMEDIKFKVALDSSATMELEAKRAGIPKNAIIGFNVDLRSYQFYIPKSNPLYNDDEVRDAVGMPRVPRKKTALEEFAGLSAGLSGEMATLAGTISGNVDRMTAFAGEDPQQQEKVSRFVEKYIPLVNDVLRAYKHGGSGSGGDAGAEDRDGEVLKTLKNMAAGSENFLKKLQSKGEMDSEVAKTVIEQQLIADGLIDPMNDNK